MNKRIPIFSRAAFLFALFLAAIPCAPAADQDAAPAPPGQIRVDVLMVSMPEEKYLTLLPDLLDKNKIEKTVSELLEAVKRKEMVLEGYPVVVTKSGQRATTEASMNPVSPPPNFQPSANWPFGAGYTPVNDANAVFVPQPLGVLFDVTPVVSPDGRIIDIDLSVAHMELLGYENFPPSKKKNIDPSQDNGARQPIYFIMKADSCLCLHTGQHLLLAVHKKAKPEGAVEIFILHAETLPVGK